MIKEVPTSSLPRERMEIYGAEALSDQELLAILLRTGQHPYSVMSIAGNLLKTFGGLASLRQATLHELEEIRGIGRVKAIEIKALIELGRRIQTDHEKSGSTGSYQLRIGPAIDSGNERSQTRTFGLYLFGHEESSDLKKNSVHRFAESVSHSS